MDFKNPEIADKYSMAADKDSLIQVPGYHGNLSEVNDLKIVQGMINRGSKLVVEKPAKGAKTNTSNSNDNK